MKITVWNSAKSRLETIDVEFTDDNTTWLKRVRKENTVQTLNRILDDRL